jgi:hypothetical protein
LVASTNYVDPLFNNELDLEVFYADDSIGYCFRYRFLREKMSLGLKQLKEKYMKLLKNAVLEEEQTEVQGNYI